MCALFAVILMCTMTPLRLVCMPPEAIVPSTYNLQPSSPSQAKSQMGPEDEPAVKKPEAFPREGTTALRKGIPADTCTARRRGFGLTLGCKLE